MSESEFARNQLKKHGWSEGSGLGKDETGMKDAIKVKIKNNKTGIGHDPGAEFTTSWWQDVFNKTANSIQVEASQDGEVTVKRLEEKTKKKKEIESRKTALYGRFVKAATLTQEGGRSVEKVDADRSSSSSDDEDEDKSLRPSEEAVYKQCEGRTAHKGARHGLGLSGKLQRVEEMERDLLEKMTRSQHGSKEKKKREKANEDSDKDVRQSREMEMISEEDSVLVRKKSKKKKKLNKSSDDEVDLNGEMEQDNFSEDLGQETNDLRNKSKKKKKKKDKEIEFESDCVDKKRTHEESDCEQGDEIRKKSKKKKKEKENDNHIVEETENIDITNSESSKKKKKKKKRSEQD